MVCDSCHKELKVGEWPWCDHGRMHQGPSPGGNHVENAVVYVSAQEGGKVQYPGRTDQAIPERLRQRGYERVTIAPSQMGQFEKRYGVANERRHYDRNGKTD